MSNNIELISIKEISEQNEFTVQIGDNIINTKNLVGEFTKKDFFTSLNKHILYHNLNHNISTYPYYTTLGGNLNLNSAGSDYANLSDLVKKENFLVEKDFDNNRILRPFISFYSYIPPVFNNMKFNVIGRNGFDMESLNFGNLSGGPPPLTQILRTFDVETVTGNGGPAKLSLLIYKIDDNGNITYEISDTNSFTSSSNYKIGDILRIKDLQKEDNTDITITVEETTKGIKHMNLLQLDKENIGEVISIQNVNSGSIELTTGQTDVECTGGSGSGCRVTYTVTNGKINIPIKITNGGVNYKNNEILTIKNTDATFQIKNELNLYNILLYKGVSGNDNLRLKNNTPIILKYSEEITLPREFTQIYKNKYYMDFPLNLDSPEFPFNVTEDNWVSTREGPAPNLYNCIVIGFNFSQINAYKIKKLRFAIENNNNLRLIGKLKLNNIADIANTTTTTVSRVNYVLKNGYLLEGDYLYVDSINENNVEINFGSEIQQSNILQDENKIFGRLYIGLKNPEDDLNDNSLEQFDLKIKIETDTDGGNSNLDQLNFSYGLLYP